ncbi:MAG: hypothetical protein ACWGPN_17440, partial [Gammaproteobacteria bacterium]
MRDKSSGSGRDLKAMLAEEASRLPRADRRTFLKTGLTVAGGAMMGAAARGAGAATENLPPNVP